MPHTKHTAQKPSRMRDKNTDGQCEEIKPVPFSSKGNAPPSQRAPMQGHFTAALNAERNGSLDRATQ